ncbi:hypothetical protein B0T09DRAFT_240714, partial [Sordaria sp. MPI-SDFR-AT-0083]
MKFSSLLFLTSALSAYAAPTGSAPGEATSLAARNPDAPGIISTPPPTIRAGARRYIPGRRDPQRNGQAPPPAQPQGGAAGGQLAGQAAAPSPSRARAVVFEDGGDFEPSVVGKRQRGGGAPQGGARGGAAPAGGA